jgi:multiple sugar transport system ATP-binding protein
VNTVSVKQNIACPQNGELTLGIRAEDAQLCDHDRAHIIAEVFACELLGNEVMVTVKLAGQSLTIKADKAVRHSFGERVGVHLPARALYWFDTKTGQRIRI